GEKIHKIMDLALKLGVPMIGLNDGAGARIQEGVVSLDAYGGIFYRNVQSSGVIPQISVIMGPCAGGAVYSPAMTDFVFMVDGTSYMFITGPDVVKTVTGEEVTQQELGGAVTHASKSGVCQFIAADDKACLDDVRYLLSFLPANNLEDPPVFATTDDPQRLCPDLIDLIPATSNQPYDMHKVIESVVDDGEFFEYARMWAPNIVCGFARMDGHPVGIVGNQPMHLAGVLDIESSEKAARFVRTCDAFNIPLLTFVDVPGFLPGVDQEYGGIIRHGAKLLYAYCESTVPRIQIVVRKAYGGAYVVMNSKSIGADLAFAWPSAELAVMGPQGAVEIVYRRELQTAADPDARKAELVEEYTERFANPYGAAERGFVDDVIDPADTRAKIIAGFELLRSKREELPKRKHGNSPL
ncbi:MAG: acetyl-CoA/propionyl-CoA carboxylase carboxyl transferase subunit, partial [Acidimicrobiaceae bacterium]|nr:acetyl-CoA/propionyl-CoA carboxylase carboxyl transferase subunit [Acidimicrobiaceae bacterium]